MASTFVVTACNRGLGLEFARQLAGRGDRVIATAREPSSATELAALGVETHELDVASAGSVSRFAAALGEQPIDVLINNAGVGVSSTGFESLDFDQMERFFRINTIGPLRLVRGLLSALRAGSTRKVVNLTSRMGSIADNSSGAAYSYRASKAALNMVTRSLAIDLQAEGFACVVLHPGWVQTDMGGQRAPVTPADSVAGMLAIVDRMSSKESGGFFDFTGAPVPW